MSLVCACAMGRGKGHEAGVPQLSCAWFCFSNVPILLTRLQTTVVSGSNGETKTRKPKSGSRISKRLPGTYLVYRKEQRKAPPCQKKKCKYWYTVVTESAGKTEVNPV